MAAVRDLLLIPLLSLAFQASVCYGACVEVDSDTEAQANIEFKVGCISCKQRGEVQAQASVHWSFKGTYDNEYTPIYSYYNNKEKIEPGHFTSRLSWAGSTNTLDLQDGSLRIRNVSYNDTGMYRCEFNRRLIYPNYECTNKTIKLINLNVVEKLTRGMASILSEVMMYVSIIGLQVWLVVEMIYCYRKIAAAGEEALRESAAEYLAIASESKDNCTGVQVEAE